MTALARREEPSVQPLGRAESVGIDPDRLWADVMALAAITDPAEPFTRRSFSPLFMEGRHWLQRRFEEAGLAARLDAAGNLIGRRPGRNSSLGTVLIGSHSDTVPAGGRFDGIAGVITGLEIARALADRDERLDHDLEVVDFLAEEPSEYGLSCVGSRGMAAELSAAHLALANCSGETLAAAIARVGGEVSRLAEAVRSDIVAAFELHIEQGPVLEAEAIDLGIVTGIVGIARFEIVFEGTADHAGTTPMNRRRDALVAAAELISWVRVEAESLAGRGAGYFVATTGIVESAPNAANVVPRMARIVVDARSEDQGLIDAFASALDAKGKTLAAGFGVERLRHARLSSSKPALCDPQLRALLKRNARALGYSEREMASGAGHDMAFLSRRAPASMVFVPCRGGRSHCPEEWTSREAIAAGAAVILGAMLERDRMPSAAAF